MGRPLNKRNFGAPTAGGNEIKVQFHNGTGSVDGWIVKQLGSKKFRCSDGTNEAICWMVDKAAGTLLENEMTISVKDDAGVVKQAIKIAAHKMTPDTGGPAIGWTFDDSAIDGRVEIEEAGDPTNAIADGNFVIGEEYEVTTVGTTTLWTEVGCTVDTGNLGEIFVATATGTVTPGDGFATSTADLQGDTFGT